MASARKSGKSQAKETHSRAAQEEDRRPWLNEVSNEGDFGEENEPLRGRIPLARRRSPTLTKKSTPERRFNELISAIHSMTGAITTMQRQMSTIHRRVGGQEEPKRHISPPHPIQDEVEEFW